jgi:hypothetical protein
MVLPRIGVSFSSEKNGPAFRTPKTEKVKIKDEESTKLQSSPFQFTFSSKFESRRSILSNCDSLNATRDRPESLSSFKKLEIDTSMLIPGYLNRLEINKTDFKSQKVIPKLILASPQDQKLDIIKEKLDFTSIKTDEQVKGRNRIRVVSKNSIHKEKLLPNLKLQTSSIAPLKLKSTKKMLKTRRKIRKSFADATPSFGSAPNHPNFNCTFYKI